MTAVSHRIAEQQTALRIMRGEQRQQRVVRSVSITAI